MANFTYIVCQIFDFGEYLPKPITIYSLFAVFDDVKVISASACFGDLDYDGFVDGLELSLLAADFGRTDCESEILGIWIGDEIDGETDSWSFSFIADQFHVVGYREWHRGTYIINKSMNPCQMDLLIETSKDPSAAASCSNRLFRSRNCS